MKKKTFNKEQILNRLEKSHPVQLEARLEMKTTTGAGAKIWKIYFGTVAPLSDVTITGNSTVN